MAYNNFDFFVDNYSPVVPKNLNSYTIVQYVAQCTDKIVCDVLSQPYYFYDKKTGKVIEQDKIPNTITNIIGNNFQDLKSAIIAQMLLNGNAYILKSRENAYDLLYNKPSKLHLLRADKMAVDLSADSLSILSYTSSQTGKVYEPKDIIHFKQTPIYNGLIGIGNIEKILKLAQTDLEQQELEYQFMNNRGMSPFIVTVEGGSLPTEQDQINAKRDFDKKMNASENAGKAHIFWSDGKINLHNIAQQNIKDMLPIERDQYKREQILSIFGVPLSVLGIPNSSQKNTDLTQESKYYRSTINPKIQYIDDMLNQQLISILEPSIEMRTKKIAVGDTQTIINQLSSGIITPNRAAELLGEEADWEDESRNLYYIQSSLVPMAMASTQPQTKKKTISDDLEVKSYLSTIISTIPQKKQFQLKYLRSGYLTKKAVENKYTYTISDFYDAQIKKIMQKIADNWESINNLQKKDLLTEAQLITVILSIEEQQKDLEKVMRAIYTSTVQRTIADINAITGSKINLETSNPFVSSAIRQLGARITTGTVDANGNSIYIGETTRKQFENIIVESINQNLSLADVQEKIAALGEQWSGPRSRLIARTEISKAHDFGSYVSFTELKVKFFDLVGCTQFEPNSDCGATNLPIERLRFLNTHPGHKGTAVPSKEINI